MATIGTSVFVACIMLQHAPISSYALALTRVYISKMLPGTTGPSRMPPDAIMNARIFFGSGTNSWRNWQSDRHVIASRFTSVHAFEVSITVVWWWVEQDGWVGG
jgi:hypothetical protein